MQKTTRDLWTAGAVLLAAVILAVLFWKVPNADAHEVEEPSATATDVAAEPEVVVVYMEPEKETPPPAFYADFADLTDEERGLLAMVVYRECRGQERNGQKAVAEVVLNRVRNPEFPSAVKEVVYQKWDGYYQFSCAPALTTQSIQELNCLSYAFGVVDEVTSEAETVIPDRYLYFSTKAPKTSDYMKIGDHYFW